MVLAVRCALTSFVLLLALFVVFPRDAPSADSQGTPRRRRRRPRHPRSRRRPRGGGPLIARQVFDTLVAYREGSTDDRSRPGHALGGVARGLTWTFTLARGRPLPRRQPCDRCRGGGELPAQMPRARGGRLAGAAARPARACSRKSARPMRIPSVPIGPTIRAAAHRARPPGAGIARTTTGPDGTPASSAADPTGWSMRRPGGVALEAVPGTGERPPRAERHRLPGGRHRRQRRGGVRRARARHLVSARRRLAG